MKKVVFICRGNMYRGQIAKGIYNHFRKDSYAEAYGTNVIEQRRQGILLSTLPQMEFTLKELKLKGIDISHEHCEQLTPEYLHDASKLIVMTEKEDIPKWLTHYTYEYWTVPNPEFVTKEIFEKTYNLLYSKISSLELS